MRPVASVLLGVAIICCACAVAEAGTIVIWERTPNEPNGTLTENGAIYSISPPVVAGYVVLLEPTIVNPALDPAFWQDRNNWSDVLYFIATTSPAADHFQLLSDGCDTPADPLSCFPSLGTVMGANSVFTPEWIVSPAPPEWEDSAFTLYQPSPGYPGYDYAGAPGNVYEIHSTSATPEPATLLLIGAGLSVLGFWRKRAAR